jgi:hypothetical protein
MAHMAVLAASAITPDNSHIQFTSLNLLSGGGDAEIVAGIGTAEEQDVLAGL